MNFDYEALIKKEGYLTVLSNIAGCIENDDKLGRDDDTELVCYEAKRLMAAIEDKV